MTVCNGVSAGSSDMRLTGCCACSSMPTMCMCFPCKLYGVIRAWCFFTISTCCCHSCLVPLILLSHHGLSLQAAQQQQPSFLCQLDPGPANAVCLYVPNDQVAHTLTWQSQSAPQTKCFDDTSQDHTFHTPLHPSPTRAIHATSCFYSEFACQRPCMATETSNSLHTYSPPPLLQTFSHHIRNQKPFRRGHGTSSFQFRFTVEQTKDRPQTQPPPPISSPTEELSLPAPLHTHTWLHVRV